MKYAPTNRMRNGATMRPGASQNAMEMATAMTAASKTRSQTSGEFSSLRPTRKRSTPSEGRLHPPSSAGHLDAPQPVHFAHKLEDSCHVERVLDPAPPADVGHRASRLGGEGQVPEEDALRFREFEGMSLGPPSEHFEKQDATHLPAFLVALEQDPA